MNPGGSETLTLKIQHKDATTGDYIDLATSGVQFGAGGTGDYVILLIPGVGAAANDVDLVAGYQLGRTFRIAVTHSASGSWTYSVSVDNIL